jgi:IPT/TIG domain-containing protein/dockerin type I repeat protein/cohesin domain-containing protein/galactose oxidase-like protein
MKTRWICLSLLATIAISKTAVADNPLTGDLNGDRVIDVNDFSLLYGYLQGNVALSPAQLQAADIDRDGAVTMIDLRRGMGRYGRRIHFEVPPFDPFDPARPVLNRVSPGFGPASTLVTLTGTGFDPNPDGNIVRLGGMPVAISSASATTITFRVPTGAGSGAISVEVGGLESCGVPFLVGSAPPTTNPNVEPLGPTDLGIVFPTTAVAPGSRIELPVQFDSGDHDLVGTDFRITFDPTVLHAVEMEALPAVRFGQHFYRCIDNTTGVIAGAFGFGRTPGGAVQVANLVFDVVGTPGRVALVGGRLNAIADMAQPSTLSAGPRFLGTSQSFVLVSDGTFSESLRLLDEPIAHATVNALADGRVLVAGGDSTDGRIVSTATLFDPTTGSVVTLPTGLLAARTGHTATTLADGRVVVAGGRDAGGPLRSIEIFDPAIGAFRLASASLSDARFDHAAVPLADGRIVWLGGTGSGGTLASVEVFDPATESVTRLGTPMLLARSSPSAAQIVTGEVVVTGGIGSDGRGIRMDATEIYDPATATTLLAEDGSGHTIGASYRATRLPSGTVLLTGEDTADRFDVDEREFDSLAALLDSRTGHVAVPLPNDALFVVGGWSRSSSSVPVLRTSEVVSPAGSGVSAGPRLYTARAEASGVTLPDGRVVVVGGLDWNHQPIGQIEVVRP